jgi:glycosyltransferase involved in cell wall biosynthesis
MYISHFVGLSSIGGVQRNFVEYINNSIKLNDRLSHKVYTLGEVDPQYRISVKVYNIKKFKNLLSLILDIVSRNRIVHFYNNLISLKVATLLFLLPVHKLILHERGTIWNAPSSRGPLLRFVAWKSCLILVNSNATRIMLEKKFYIFSEKIRVLHNGIDTTIKCTKKRIKRENLSPLRVGFIGRLDTPKGVHVLIDAMRYLVDNNIELVIAGDGALKHVLKSQAEGINNISFIGRVADPYIFLSSIDLLVVPSIREPLGNVCIEAGLCRVPVLAANVDGIPEIIKHKKTGELINATEKISIDLPVGAIPIPEFVIDSTTKELCTPMQISPKLLARKILELTTEPKKLECYANNLHDEVIDYFNINRYSAELHAIYREIDIL